MSTLADRSVSSDSVRDKPGLVAAIVDRFPCLSESFIRNELVALEGMGLPLLVVACSPRAHEDADLAPGIEAEIVCSRGPGSPGLVACVAEMPSAVALTRLARSIVPATLRGWRLAARAVEVALRVGPRLRIAGVAHVHGHFLHLPGLVARLLARLLGVTYSLAAHARDLFVPALDDLDALCCDARFISVCSDHARACLLGRLSDPSAARVVSCRHGVVLADFAEHGPRRAPTGLGLRLLSVGRLVPKKGIDVVLDALRILKADDGMPVTLRVVGAGPERARLGEIARTLGRGRVTFLGRCRPTQVRAELAAADVFVLGCRVARDGDRDGIPNALVEAMAAGVAVIASDAGGVCELVAHRRTGLLVPPDNPQALARALRQLRDDAALRDALVQRAGAEVAARFDLQENVLVLHALLASPTLDRSPA